MIMTEGRKTFPSAIGGWRAGGWKSDPHCPSKGTAKTTTAIMSERVQKVISLGNLISTRSGCGFRRKWATHSDFRPATRSDPSRPIARHGSDERCGSLFSYVDLKARVGADHPLRTIQEIANAALADLRGEFAVLYPARLGRPSIPPERLLRAMLLQAFYGIRSERQMMDRMESTFCSAGLGVDDPARDHSSFSKNRDRLLEGEIAAKFLAAVVAQPKVKRLL